MEILKDKEVFIRLSQNSVRHNVDCLIEEMAELTQNLLKEMRGKPDRDNLAEEIAQVRYMLDVTTKCMNVPLQDIEIKMTEFEARMRKHYIEQGRGEDYDEIDLQQSRDAER